ncbi:hypothetical protein GRF29_96g890362 [Pseudopithomyces chartarum]|uniref:Uncharacterized protein n=1 Tax=Pseudopithomyces chartarum TaxID=1892770 RepID=A0AAN6RGK8_9PLEO|nr:hypothetical protein GRF29_96g890362 [Pseudopithomyces chartarum]
MFGFGAAVEAVDGLILYLLYVVFDMSFWTAAAWSEFMATIIVYVGAFVIGRKITRWAMSPGTLIAWHLSPPQPNDTRRERRISTAAVRTAPFASSPTPHARPEYLSSSPSTTYGKFRGVNKRPHEQRHREDNAIMDCGIPERNSRPRYKFDSHNRLVPREKPAATYENPRSVSHPDNICVSAESDTHESPAAAKMSTTLAVSGFATPVVALSSTGLATGTMSFKRGLIEPLQCRGAAPAADAGRAHVPTSTESMAKQDVEPLWDACVESTRASPVLAPVPVSTDEMAKPIPSDSVANAPTWRPSSGPVYKLRGPDPRFTTTNAPTANMLHFVHTQQQVPVPTWRPSSGPVYKLRGPDPRFATNNPLAVQAVQSVPTQKEATAPTWRPSSGPVYKLRGPDPRFATKSASPTVSAVQDVPHTSTPEPTPMPSALSVPAISSAQALSISPDRTSCRRALPQHNLPVSEARKAVASNPEPTLAATSPSCQNVPLERNSVSMTLEVAAPAPAPLSAPTRISTLAPTNLSASSTPSASVGGIYPMTQQDWMRPISEMLALDIERWEMSEEELMTWKILPNAVKVTQLSDQAAEEKARRDPFTLASRYGDIAVELKKTLVLMRLQLAHSRPFFRPDYGNFDAVRKMILTATASFTQMSNHNLDSDDFPGVDFSLFKNALGFFVNHIADDPTFLIWVRENRLNHGSDIVTDTKRKAKYVNAIAGGKHSRAAHRLAQS